MQRGSECQRVPGVDRASAHVQISQVRRERRNGLARNCPSFPTGMARFKKGKALQGVSAAPTLSRRRSREPSVPLIIAAGGAVDARVCSALSPFLRTTSSLVYREGKRRV
ncbi:hypothetical protein MRX96_035974 [Rhipicephalus microplus]